MEGAAFSSETCIERAGEVFADVIWTSPILSAAEVASMRGRFLNSSDGIRAGGDPTKLGSTGDVTEDGSAGIGTRT